MLLTLGGYQVIASLHRITGIWQLEFGTHGVARHRLAVTFEVSDESNNEIWVFYVCSRNRLQIGPGLVSQAEPHQLEQLLEMAVTDFPAFAGRAQILLEFFNHMKPVQQHCEI